MKRDVISFRLHRFLVERLQRQARGLGITDGAMLEMILGETFKDSLPATFRPGMRMPNEKKDEKK